MLQSTRIHDQQSFQTYFYYSNVYKQVNRCNTLFVLGLFRRYHKIEVGKRAYFIVIRGSARQTQIQYTICTMLDQRRRRWADVVQMLCKYCFFVFVE